MSIFGSQKPDSRLLILEEIETAEQVVGTFKKIFCFSLLFPTEAEFSAALKKVVDHGYPIERVIQEKNRRSIVLNDPEENQIELCYYLPKDTSNDQQGTFDTQVLLTQVNGLVSNLSADVKIERLRMPVENYKQYHFFYQDILGLPITNEESGLFSWDQDHCSIELIETPHEALSFEKNEESLGIEFIIIPKKNRQEMEQLKQHLDLEDQAFFVDKKRTILTIYDPGNTEWWFVHHE